MNPGTGGPGPRRDRGWSVSSGRPAPPRVCLLPLLPAALAALAAGATAGLSTAAAAPAGEPAPRATFFVAQGGNDAWSGRLAAPAAGGADGPFATTARARDALRELRARGELKEAPVVLIRGGIHFLAAPLVFGPEDSGTEQAPVTFASYPGEKAVLSGGRRIAGWKPVAGEKLRAADVPEARAGQWSFRQLFVGGERRPRTRLPKQGFHRVEALPDVKAGAPWNEGQKRFRYAPGDLRAWPSVAGAEVVALHFWVESRMGVAAIDEAERIVTLKDPSTFRLTDDHGSAFARYYLENVREALDQAGEWHLDPAAGRLVYFPRPDEDPERAEVIAPRLGELVRFEGSPGDGKFVEHLVLRGLEFAHAEPSSATAERLAGSSQAAVRLPGAIRLIGARRCAIEECAVRGVEGYGIELAGGCVENRVVKNEVTDLGAGGIKVGETRLRPEEAWRTGKNLVAENHLHDGGKIHHSAVGIWVGHSGDNVIARNHVHHFFYTGLSIGWSWGYGPSGATRNLIEGNHVHHIGQGLLSDMGGIYTLGLSPGSVIRGNVFHDIESHGYGGWGIYFDEGTTGMLAEKNLVYRVKSNGFHQHYGKENVVRNNIFALGREAQIARSREEGHLSFTFERNIVYWTEGKLLSGTWSTAEGYRFDRNLYFFAPGEGKDPAIRFADWSLEEWRARGQDRESRISDPLFADPAGGDFTLRPGSPAFELGFEPLAIGAPGAGAGS
jgi:hypothetical protein